MQCSLLDKMTQEYFFFCIDLIILHDDSTTKQPHQKKVTIEKLRVKP